MKKLKQLLSLFVLVVFVPALVFAQAKTVTGRVTDSKDNSPLADATVSVVGKSTSAKTGPDGSFTIAVPDGSTKLRVSYVGYADQIVTISGETVNISLATAAQNLTDVVVIGYGTARKKDVTGAIASVSSKDFNQGINTNPDQLLQNKVAGVEITANNGQPGSAATVKIRGNNSIRAVNNPLYVIDGVPLDGRSARPNFGTASFGSSPDANPLIFLNPADIQSIDVLKDASSAAIYGSRGANGVIVITTKTGSSGPMKVEFGASAGFNLGLMKNYDILSSDEFRSALTKYKITGQDKNSSVNAMKEVLNSDITRNFNLALSGGNEFGKFRASFLGSTTVGPIKNSQLDKYIGNFSGQYKFLDNKLTLGFNLTTGHTTENLVAVSNTAGSVGNLISSILSWNPTQSFRDDKGNFIYPDNGSGNPLALLAGVNDIAKVNTVLANMTASYKLSNSFEYRFMYAVNNSNGTRNTNQYGFMQGYSGLSGIGYGAISNAELSSQTVTHTLNFKKEVSQDLRIDALAGFEYWKSSYSNNSFAARGFNTNLDQNNIIFPYTNMLQNGNSQEVPITNVDPKVELQSYFGRASLSYKDKYSLIATLRADGSSRFGSNNKYGLFPAIGVRWSAINEDFLKNNSVFSNLALRASWGITGNQEFPAGASQEQFRFSNYNTAGQINVANPDLKWEQTKSYNIGIDWASHNGKVYGSVDYYSKNTTNILFQSTAIQPAPASIFFVNLPANLMNTGVEISLGADVINKKNFTWSVRGYYAYNKNMLKNFTQNGKDIKIITGEINGQGVSGTLSQVITNNQPVNAYYLKQFTGYDQAGKQTYTDNPVVQGDPNPQSGYGVSTTLTYKKVSLVINGGGSGGYLIYSNTRTNITNIAGIKGGRNIDRLAYESVETPESPVAANSRFLESGNFFKIRNLSATYRIGSIGKYIKNLSASVTVNNLMVFTKFSGFDPEVNIDKSNNNYPSRSIEYIPYPTGRTLTAGFSFSL